MTSKFKLIAVVGLWFTMSAATAAEAFRWDERVQRGQLDNGFTYYIVDGKTMGSTVSLQLVVRAGSLDERDDQSGVAHMVEHMVFKASAAHPEGVGNYMESQGWRIGKHYNAQTNFERTLYQLMADKKPDTIAAGVGALAQIAGGAQIPADALERERQVILEEWRGKLGVRERMDRQRRAMLREGSLYPQRPTIGTEASIRTQPAESLRKFYQDWYRPGNMALVVVGDVDAKTLRAQIAAAFNGLKPAALPARNAADPVLRDQLQILRLQDSESGTSQVGFVNRFAVDKRQDDEGLRARLVDRVAERSLRALVRQAADSLPAGVSSLTSSKGELGEATASLGFASSVAVGSHQAGLRQILVMRERVRRDGLREDDIRSEIAEIRRLNAKGPQQQAARDFQGWQQMLVGAVQAERVLQDPQQKQAQIGRIADAITPAEVNARVRQWIHAPDRAVFMLAPGLSSLTLPTAAEVLAMQKALAAEPLPALVKVNKEAPAALPAVVLPEIESSGAVVRQDDLGEGVQRWTLDNGDSVVWRYTPNDTVMRFAAQSGAGYRLPGAPGWQWQLAAQLGNAADLEGQERGEMARWSAGNKVRLSQQQTETQLAYTAQVPAAQLDDLFLLYAAGQAQSEISQAALSDASEQLARVSARRPDSAGDRASREMSRLRYGERLPADAMPDVAAVQELDSQAGLQLVRRQWRQLTALPVTYFVSGPADAATVRAAVERHLAGIARQAPGAAAVAPTASSAVGVTGAGTGTADGTATPAFAASALQQAAGYRESRLAIGIEPQGSVRAHGSQPLAWSPERAMRTAIVSRIVYRQLRTELREKEAGIYRLNYKLSLEPQGRLTSELSFTAAPERLDALWASARAVLENLPTRIDTAMLDEEIQQMRSDEGKRKTDATAQFNRLQLSYARYGDARYLKESGQLAAGLTPGSVRALAQEFRLAGDLVVVTVLPKDAAPQ
ncbi:UNVERIFIED_ORG: zinc protease [Zoogloea ramigera]|uniref:Insulinase family protein n=1 Tax=Duganella zoogloeoides TaxID=75659 RepID=A0ABZ0Y138_9BURK|nr:M16 family metallopeptidase [Duganella zoogloeoides]WQH05060.1 insulinase family protein [Duganella zoogloeoides]